MELTLHSGRTSKRKTGAMAIFLTGSTGYIGAHVAANLLRDHGAALNVLVRARDPREAEERLWQALQLHLDFPQFYEHLQTRVRIFRGDLTQPGLRAWARRVRPLDAHHRFGDSLRGVVEPEVGEELPECEPAGHAGSADAGAACRALSRAAPVQPGEHGGGGGEAPERSGDRGPGDRLGALGLRSLCAHQEILRAHDAGAAARTPNTIFRPSIVLGDSRYAETTQFDMVKAFVFLAGLPVLPFRPTDKIDIVNVDFVADAIATLHQKDHPQYDTYHLSSGMGSQTFREITKALAAAQQKRAPVFAPFVERPFAGIGEFSFRTARGRWDMARR